MIASNRTARRLKELLDNDPFEMDSEERESSYRELDDVMKDHYQKVHSRALKKRRRYIRKRREAGTKTVHGRTFEDDHHTKHADQKEERMKEDIDAYYGSDDSVGAQHFHHILAILTGRYDTRYWGENGDLIKEVASRKLGTLKGEAILTRAREQGYSCSEVNIYPDHEDGEVKREEKGMLV